MRGEDRNGFDNLIFVHVKFLGFEANPWRRHGLGSKETQLWRRDFEF